MYVCIYIEIYMNCFYRKIAYNIHVITADLVKFTLLGSKTL